MAELTEIQPGQVFAARSFKRIDDTFWVNTYEFQYTFNTAITDGHDYLKDIADALYQAELYVHSDKVTIDRIIISSIERDSVPYNPETFAVFSYNGTGLGITGDHTLMPLSTCVLVKKETEFGRSGNILYRGALSVTSGEMTPRGFKIDIANATRIESALDGLLQALDGLNTILALVKLTDTGQIDNVRKVVNISVRNLTTTKKLYNRYFDKLNGTG